MLEGGFCSLFLPNIFTTFGFSLANLSLEGPPLILSRSCMWVAESLYNCVGHSRDQVGPSCLDVMKFCVVLAGNVQG